MNVWTFNEIVKEQINKSIDVLFTKGQLYTSKSDRLSNFKKAAALQNIEPETALFGMVAKHIVALSDFIIDIENHFSVSTAEWNEKITDIINYMLLLKALIVERKGREYENITG